MRRLRGYLTTQVKHLYPGTEIAVADGYGIKWTQIASIVPTGKKQVYDIEVEGTHNFVGNGIVAHNTTVGVTAQPAEESRMDRDQPVGPFEKAAKRIIDAVFPDSDCPEISFRMIQHVYADEIDGVKPPKVCPLPLRLFKKHVWKQYSLRMIMDIRSRIFQNRQMSLRVPKDLPFRNARYFIVRNTLFSGMTGVILTVVGHKLLDVDKDTGQISGFIEPIIAALVRHNIMEEGNLIQRFIYLMRLRYVLEHTPSEVDRKTLAKVWVVFSGAELYAQKKNLDLSGFFARHFLYGDSQPVDASRLYIQALRKMIPQANTDADAIVFSINEMYKFRSVSDDITQIRNIRRADGEQDLQIVMQLGSAFGDYESDDFSKSLNNYRGEVTGHNFIIEDVGENVRIRFPEGFQFSISDQYDFNMDLYVRKGLGHEFQIHGSFWVPGPAEIVLDRRNVPDELLGKSP